MKLVFPLVGLVVLGTAGYAVTTKVLSSSSPTDPPTGVASLQAVDAAGADPASAAAAAPSEAPTWAAAQATPEGEISLVERLAEVPKGGFDPLSIPLEDGIVWYGTWEDAMAEKERTGKPVLLHFGSPRCPSSQKVCVPGVW